MSRFVSREAKVTRGMGDPKNDSDEEEEEEEEEETDDPPSSDEKAKKVCAWWAAREGCGWSMFCESRSRCRGGPSGFLWPRVGGWGKVGGPSDRV